MLVLALNCGSSSVKFGLYDAGSGELVRLADGTVDRVTDRPLLRTERRGAPAVEVPLAASGHEAAAAAVVDWLSAEGSLPGGVPDLVGHRAVHGGPRYRTPVVIDEEVLAAIEQAAVFARLHNAPALAVIRAMRRRLGSRVPQVAVFDTAFHRAMPLRASRYAIPLELAEPHSLERFGFHGIAHRYMAEAVAEARGVELADLRLITLQLGSGCSAAAIAGGRSIDTTMGLTPLEGLMMATRSGDIDPALPALLARAEGVSIEEVQAWLNERSGLLGVSGRSADVRELVVAEAAGDGRAALALEMFCYRVRKQIGAYLAALEGADAIVFGGGIGEHQPEIRRRVCEPLASLSVHLDGARNATGDAPVWRISAEDSPLTVYVVRVDEQRAIAEEALASTRTA